MDTGNNVSDRHRRAGAGPFSLVTDGVIPLLGISPALGRSFTRKDASPGNPDTVIRLNGHWRCKISGDPASFGRRIRIDGKSGGEVIGVMPQNFRFLDMDVELIQPFQFDRNKTFLGILVSRAWRDSSRA